MTSICKVTTIPQQQYYYTFIKNFQLEMQVGVKKSVKYCIYIELIQKQLSSLSPIPIDIKGEVAIDSIPTTTSLFMSQTLLWPFSLAPIDQSTATANTASSSSSQHFPLYVRDKTYFRYV